MFEEQIIQKQQENCAPMIPQEIYHPIFDYTQNQKLNSDTDIMLEEIQHISTRVFKANDAKILKDVFWRIFSKDEKDLYTKYYRPNNYQFEDLVESLRIVRKYNGWASINYFVFPGVTDSAAEFDALCSLISATDLSMIQWRSFNIDPDWYLGKMGIVDPGECFGIRQMIEMIHEEFPKVKFGYFNPPIERMKNYDEAFAH